MVPSLATGDGEASAQIPSPVSRLPPLLPPRPHSNRISLYSESAFLETCSCLERPCISCWDCVHNGTHGPYINSSGQRCIPCQCRMSDAVRAHVTAWIEEHPRVVINIDICERCRRG